MSPNEYEWQLLRRKKNLNVTNLEKAAWAASDNLAKTIKYLYLTDLSEAVRTKIIRDMIKDNLINFYKQESNTKEVETRPNKEV